MKTISLLGIDLAKNIFQLHGIDSKGKAVLKRKVSRSKLYELIANLPPCTIAMEACGGAHYLARKFQEGGHEVKLIAPQFVKPYVKRNKNDAADAQAICKAALDEDMIFVAPKEIWQQDLQSIHRIRERLVKNRTALMNETRGILYEFGITIPQGVEALSKQVQKLLTDEENSSPLSSTGKSLLQDLYSEWIGLDQNIQSYEKRLKEFTKQTPDCHRLLKVGGLGLISATALLVALGNAHQFKNGRHFSAWLGLVPKHRGTGGKNRLLGISKRGDQYMRALLVHGARSMLKSVIRKVAKGEELNVLNQWIYRLYSKKGWNKTCVALANKNARIAWALISSEEKFDPKKAAKIMP